MPAEITVASGYVTTRAGSTSASLAYAATGSPPNGATPITPPSRSPPAVSIVSARSSIEAGRDPSAMLRLGRRVEAHLDQAVDPAVARRAPPS